VGDFAEAVGGPPPCGLLVPPGDVEALAAAIARLHAAPELRAQLGRAGLAQARGPRRPMAVGETAEAVYAEILRRLD
jgi:glycosyltransferase involved in cell wall biosynthesis